MTSHGHYPINPAGGFPTGFGKWSDDALWQVFQGGAYWSGVVGTPGVEFKVEIALGSADGQGGSTYDNPASQYDTATYSTDDIYWVDITGRVISVRGQRGRNRLSDAFRPGAGSITLSNTDGVFNPQRGIELIGDQAMRPGRWVRLSGKQTAEDVWEPLWVLKVQSLADEYIDAAHDIHSRWDLTGLETILEARRPPALESPDPATADQTADVRARYLWVDVMDSPDQLLVTPDTYDHPMQATAFPGSRYDQMKAAAEAEGGDFYVGREGLWYMRGRGWLQEKVEAGPVLVIGDYQQADHVVLSADTSWDLTRIRNAVFLEREGGARQGQVDTASQALYGEATYSQSGLQNTNDVDVVTLVDQQLARFAFDSLRIDQLEVWSPTLAGVDGLLQLELGDVVSVNIVTAQGWSYAMNAWINGIEHEVTHTDWRVRLRIDNTFRGNPQLGGPYTLAYSDAYKRAEV